MYTDRQVERVNERETERIPVQGCDAESQSVKPNGFMKFQESVSSRFSHSERYDTRYLKM